MNEQTTDTREEVELPLHLKHLEYGCENGLAQPPSVVLSLVQEYKASLLACKKAEASLEALTGKKFSDRNHAAFRDRAEKAEAANRKKDAEIERLKLHIEDLCGYNDTGHGVSYYRSKLGKAEAELASIRASVGEKWIEIKEGCEVPEYGDTIQAICTSGDMEPWQEVFESIFTMGWKEMRDCGLTYWKRLNWPAPPTKDKE